ncbi:MAG: DUF2971 domain-containing protein [Polyangiaceae bacterium]
MPGSYKEFFLAIDAAIRKVPTRRPPNKLLYHYTRASTAVKILQDHALWASDVRCMNDTRELQHGVTLICEQADALRSRKGEHELFEDALKHPNFTSVSVFAASLSEQSDVLSQWRAYGEDGAGYAIGFDAKLIHQLQPAEWDKPLAATLQKVVYRQATQTRIAANVTSVLFDALKQRVSRRGDPDNLAIVSHALSWVVYLFASGCKSSAFREEAEWRLVATALSPTMWSTPGDVWAPKASFHVGRYGLTPYLTLPFSNDAVREVMMGPKIPEEFGRASLVALLSNSKLKEWQKIATPHAKASYR